MTLIANHMGFSKRLWLLQIFIASMTKTPHSVT